MRLFEKAFAAVITDRYFLALGGLPLDDLPALPAGFLVTTFSTRSSALAGKVPS
jgi:hypothetical protein